MDTWRNQRNEWTCHQNAWWNFKGEENVFKELYLNCKVLFHSSSVDETALHQPTLRARRALPWLWSHSVLLVFSVWDEKLLLRRKLRPWRSRDDHNKDRFHLSALELACVKFCILPHPNRCSYEIYGVLVWQWHVCFLFKNIFKETHLGKQCVRICLDWIE